MDNRLDNSKQKDFYRYAQKDEKPVKLKIDNTKVGICEIQNKRPNQEDTATVAQLNALKYLNEEQRHAAFKETIAQMQKAFSTEAPSENLRVRKREFQKEMKPGSTLLSTACWKEGNTVKTTTCWLGDSISYVVILTKDKNIKAISQLNTNLHSPSEEREQIRIGKMHRKNLENTDSGIDVSKMTDKEIGVLFTPGGRLNEQLAVSRAIGDNEFEKWGLSHDPDIQSIDFNLEADEQAILVMGCDGLTEGDEDGLSQEEIGLLIANNHNKSPEKMTEILINAARADKIFPTQKKLKEYQKANKEMELNAIVIPGIDRTKHSTRDNVSCIVMPITNYIPIINCINDGHGVTKGINPISNYLAENFQPILKNQVEKLTLEQQKKIKLEERIANFQTKSAFDPTNKIQNPDISTTKTLIEKLQISKGTSSPQFKKGEVSSKTQVKEGTFIGEHKEKLRGIQKENVKNQKRERRVGVRIEPIDMTSQQRELQSHINRVNLKFDKTIKLIESKLSFLSGPKDNRNYAKEFYDLVKNNAPANYDQTCDKLNKLSRDIPEKYSRLREIVIKFHDELAEVLPVSPQFKK